MPPKMKIKREDVVLAAFEEVRRNGPGSLNARNIARALGCSTQPVFSNFKSMAELKEATVERAYSVFREYNEREKADGRYPPYKALGVAYIRFANEEKELFKLLFMRDRSEEGDGTESEKRTFDEGSALAAEVTGLGEDPARLFQIEMWAFVHGLGVMAATGYTKLDEKLVSVMLTDVYRGLRARFSEKESGGTDKGRE